MSGNEEVKDLTDQSKKLVFVDIDGTLVSPPTAWDLLIYCLHKKIVPKTSLIYAGQQFFLNCLNRFNHKKAIDYWLNLLSGMPLATFTSYCENAFEQRIRYNFIPIMLDNILNHKKNEDHIILISSTNTYFAQTISQLLNLDGFYSLEVLIKDEKLTTDTVMPIPYHMGKVHYAKAHAEKIKMSLSNAYFYSDSISDLPLLLAVGNPIVINPDRHLKKYAQKEKWPILIDKNRTDVKEYIKAFA